MLGGHKESPPDGQYLDWTDILWHLQEKKVCVRLLSSFHAVTDLAWLFLGFSLSCFSLALDLTCCLDWNLFCLVSP